MILIQNLSVAYVQAPGFAQNEVELGTDLEKSVMGICGWITVADILDPIAISIHGVIATDPEFIEKSIVI